MRIHVTLHDVSEAQEREIRDAVTLCAGFGIRPGLLVVPRFHGGSELRAASKFAGWLRDLQAGGHEVFTHGLEHQVKAAPKTASGWFRQRVVSAGEAEFAHMTANECRQALAEGDGILQAAGLHIDGFVAPAWSMSEDVKRVLAERGCKYAEDHLWVYDPSRGKKRFVPVLNYASRSPARIASTVAYARAARPLGKVLPMRVAIHPGDMSKILLVRELRALLAWAAPHVVRRGTDLMSV